LFHGRRGSSTTSVRELLWLFQPFTGESGQGKASRRGGCGVLCGLAKGVNESPESQKVGRLVVWGGRQEKKDGGGEG